jgi:hypothetical protein
VRTMALRWAGQCVDCAAPLAPGTRACWDPERRTVHCVDCSAPSPVAAVAGGSARREYERRSQDRRDRVRARHPVLGGLLLALTDDPVSTRVWAQGARGEQAVGATLDELAGSHLSVLHDRRLRRPDGSLSTANIDHLVVAASGVWVVDAKTHRGALEVRRRGGLVGRRTETLRIGGRDQSRLLDGLARQVGAVAAQLVAVGGDVPVRGALCFVGTQLPWFGESIGGVPLVGRRGLAKLLRRSGDLAPAARDAVARHLSERFPAA